MQEIFNKRAQEKLSVLDGDAHPSLDLVQQIVVCCRPGTSATHPVCARPGVPPVITAPHVVDVGDTSVTLRWEVPAFDGLCAKKFRVR
jgi:hypothetical protein